MNNYDLSVLIPARNEMFLAKTVETLLQNKRGKTEILVGLDGKLANPPVLDHPDLTIFYSPESIGQRAMTNQLARISKAKYVMKLDAHCSVDEGFDIKLMADMQDDWTVIPAMYNLHAFDWVCAEEKSCKYRMYQAPTPEKCECGGKMKREIIWKPRLNKRSEFYRFDKTLHFQYWGAFKEREVAKGDIAPTLSAQGSCFMLTREKYWELNICDESLAGKTGWGQQGVEVALKTWMSGGKLMVNKKTWYAHMFRTQGGDFGFPYHLSNTEVDETREKSRNLFINDNWPLAIMKFKEVLAMFYPVPGWHDPVVVDKVTTKSNFAIDEKHYAKGIIFYTDNRVNGKIAHAVQNNLRKMNLPITSASLKPMPHFGNNIHLPLDRGYLTMFIQQLAALQASTADIVYMCEHDVLYHPSHFDFVPPKKDVFYYNTNVWKVDASTGHALWVDDCRQVSGLVAYRTFLIEEYKRRIAFIEKHGFTRSNGFEPGTKSIKRGGFSDYAAENFKSEFPNIDIRADHNLTPNRWKKEQFRNQDNTKGWTEGDVTKLKGWHFDRAEHFYK